MWVINLLKCLNKVSTKGEILMKDVKIAILDTGISKQMSEIVSSFFELYKDFDGNYKIENQEAYDYLGHGTAITSIIHSLEPKLNLISFKLCNSGNEISANELVYVLEYIYKNIEVDIINISAGVTYINGPCYKAINTICQKLKERGTVIVSAFTNEGAVSYPAACPSVIGIDSSPVRTNKEIIEVVNSVVNVIFPHKYYRAVWNDGKKTLLTGNSFACAYFSGLLGHYLVESENKDVNSFIKDISSDTIELLKNSEITPPKFKIQKAIIFPVNKESHALLRNQDMLSFKIMGVYDESITGNVKKDFWGIKVQSYDSLNWEDDFDTIILSCITDLQKLTKKNYIVEILKNAEKYGKNIYSFENLDSIIKETNSKVSYFFPALNKNMIPYYKFDKLNHIEIPIVAVFGTSSKQGKFTLQIDLLRKLKNRLYNVGFLATEPSGFLFSADYTFHFGYHANLDLSMYDNIALLNESIFKIQLLNRDILITGCQSAITHYDNSNLQTFSILQYAFLLGTAPDYSILCVNSYDEIDYIKRSIACINSAGEGFVEGIAIFPKEVIQTRNGLKYSERILSEQEIKDKKQNLFEIFSLPIYEIGNDADMEILCDNIINFFGEEE